MGQAILQGDPPITLALRRSGRARRLSLRVSRLDGRVTLSLPPGMAEPEAMKFVRQKETWLRRILSDCVAPVAPEVGGLVPLEGRLLPLVAGTGRAARAFPDRIEVPTGRERPALAALLKHLARDRADLSVRRHAAALGLPFGRLGLRDTRSRWGSCTSRGDLMLSWRLILAPPEVLDYVAAHEVAHLRHLDHSRAFWETVEELLPGYLEQRDWLRANGAGLHRWRFTD